MADTIKIRRVGKEPATCISYPAGKQMLQWHPDPEQSEFEVDPIIAQMAIESGFFELVPAAAAANNTAEAEAAQSGGAQAEPANADASRKTTRRAAGNKDAAGDQAKQEE